MASRRCQLGPGRTPRYTLDELHGLVGGAGVAPLRSSLRALERAGCISWRESSITFTTAPAASPDVHRMMGLIVNRRRKLPVPRRTLRLLARTPRPATVATILGYLLRSLYLRTGQSSAEGCCKASWVGEVFGVDPRNVRRAKRNLVGLGWLCPKDSDHWHRQRWGGKVAINLTWSDAAPAPSASARSPYRRPGPACEMPYPESHKELLTESKNTKPVGPGPGGASAKRVRRGKGTSAALGSVRCSDLSDARMLQARWERARIAGLVGGSDAERLSFFAAAQRALRVGRRNPPGLFVAVVKGRRWSVISQADEDRARGVLRKLEDAVALEAVSPPRVMAAPSKPATPTGGRQSAFIRNAILRSLASVGVEDLPPRPTDAEPNVRAVRDQPRSGHTTSTKEATGLLMAGRESAVSGGDISQSRTNSASGPLKPVITLGSGASGRNEMSSMPLPQSGRCG
jgi:hypothetical protein